MTQMTQMTRITEEEHKLEETEMQTEKYKQHSCLS